MRAKNVFLGQALAMALAIGNSLDKIPYYRRARGWKPRLWTMRQSRHSVHQGDRERSRRLSQIQRGIISADQVIGRQ